MLRTKRQFIMLFNGVIIIFGDNHDYYFQKRVVFVAAVVVDVERNVCIIFEYIIGYE